MTNPVSAIRDVVAAAILDGPDRPTRVLAARRSGPAELAGRWEFPGGKVEPGETCEAALVREIEEELGVAIELRVELTDGAPWLIKAGWQLRVWTAAMATDDDPPRPGDSHDEVRWLSRSELEAVDWLAPDRPAVALLDAILLD